MHNGSKYWRRLTAERFALTAGAPNPVDNLSDAAQTKDEDWATFSHDRFVSVAVQKLDCDKLKLIDLALHRLDSGSYGICVDCEKPISPKRLDAIPWASRCLKCQERFSESEDLRDEPAPVSPGGEFDRGA